MARSMWRGAISFGMVAIPVRMYLATEAHSAVSFRQLCPHCQLPIKQQRHCPTDDHVVAFNDVLKGYEVGKNQFVLIDDDDLDIGPRLPLDGFERRRNICRVIVRRKDDGDRGMGSARSPGA